MLYDWLRATNGLEGCRCGVNHPEFICRFVEITVFGDMTLRCEPTGISALEGRGNSPRSGPLVPVSYHYSLHSNQFSPLINGLNHIFIGVLISLSRINIYKRVYFWAEIPSSTNNINLPVRTRFVLWYEKEEEEKKSKSRDTTIWT